MQANIHIVSEPTPLSAQAATTVAVPIFPTQPTYINPNVGGPMLRQFPTDSQYDENYVSPDLANSFIAQYPQLYDLRQTNYQNQNNRPFTFPFLSWLNPNNNNNQYYQNGNYQNDQTNPQQQGPVISFIQGIPSAIQNFAQNNPVTQLWNGITGNNQNMNMNNNQNQNGFWNIFNPNRPSTYNTNNMQPVAVPAVQSDYMPPVHSNFDSTVFSTDHNGNYQAQVYPNTYGSNTYGNNMYSSNMYRPQNNPMYGNSMMPQNSAAYGNNYLQYLMNQNQNGQPYQFQNPYLSQLINQRPQSNGYYNNYNSNRTRNKNRKSNKKKNKYQDSQDDDYDSDSSGWFDDFLERRKRLNLETNGVSTTTVKSTD